MRHPDSVDSPRQRTSPNDKLLFPPLCLTLAVRTASLLAVLFLFSSTAFAHPQSGVSVGFKSGFLHPLSGLDHILAMVSVGIWGAQLGKPAIWLLPVTFPMVMAFGGVLGVSGVPLPGVEVGVALSALILGLMIALSARPPLWFAAVIVGIFAVFHGYAHGKELPHAAQPLAFGMAFVLATGMLHVFGILLGLIHRWPFGVRILRLAGAGVAFASVFLVRDAFRVAG
jgi:urease accessory protein